MFCEECGSPLKEGDKLCSVCGVGVRAGEAADSIHDHQNDSEQGAGAGYQQSAEREPEATDGTNLQTASDGFDERTESEETEIDNAEFSWDLEGFPVPRKTEDINFNWNVEDSKALEDEIAMPAGSEGAGGDTDYLRDFAENLDKYFNFEKENEDFQKVLDQEYEEIKDYSHPTEKHHYIERMNLASRISLGAEISGIAEIRRKSAAEIDPPAEGVIETETGPASEVKSETEAEPASEVKSEMEAESVPEVKSEFQEEPEAEQEPGRKNAVEEHTGLENTEQDLGATESDIDINESDEEEEPEVIWITGTGGDREDPAGVFNGEPETAPDTEKPEITPQEPKPPAQQTEEEPRKDPESREEGLLAQEQPAALLEKERHESEPLWFEANEEEVEINRGGCVGRTILILIIVVLLAEAALLGIQYFLPNSGAAKKAGEINVTISTTLVEWKDRAVEFFKGIGGDETGSGGVDESPENIDPETGLPVDGGENPASQPEAEKPDTVPVADKEILIAAATDLNKNIAEVKANDALTWKADRTYKIADIKNSKPIENNHWRTRPSGEHVYYDKEIVATLIDFDSKWNDYVNGGSDAVINLTKEGSQARKNAETFSKVGKVNQTFLLVEIGEIRKSDKAFYAWAYEEIEEAEGNRTTIKKYNWVYQLEPVGDEMKIVNYCNY